MLGKDDIKLTNRRKPALSYSTQYDGMNFQRTNDSGH
jgi:hypothetical protein